MFINARNSEELRIAILKDQIVNDVIYEHPGQELKKGNIYLATVTHREKSLNAIFVKYTDQEGTRDGFVPKNEILKEYFNNPEGKSFDELSVEDIPKGKEIIVQVDKEERGTKGAAITTYTSLAGRFLVLMPKNPRGVGISRRVEGENRAELKENLSQLKLPEDAGIIIRTAGVGRSIEELQWDADGLIQIWNAIRELAQTKKAPCLIYRESDAIGRAVRDYLRQGIVRIWVDNKEAWEKTRQYVAQVQPDFVDNVKYYDDPIPLFNRQHIEPQLETAFQRQVRLPSGGTIVIDQTEALVSIDVNSARATRAKNINETAFMTNIEAAREIARQLRLRDINGIIVIDFIDMTDREHQREVEKVLREEVKADRARVQIGGISRFGLLEMSRQRLRTSLNEASTVICSRCQGQGRIRAIESFALAILRLLREEAVTKRIVEVHAQLPVPVATFILNEKRADLHEIETVYQTKVLLIPNEFLDTPAYKIKGYTQDELKEMPSQSSYRLVERPKENFEAEPDSQAIKQSEPAFKSISLNLPSPPKVKPNLIKRVWETFFSPETKSIPSKSHSTYGKKPTVAKENYRNYDHKENEQFQLSDNDKRTSASHEQGYHAQRRSPHHGQHRDRKSRYHQNRYKSRRYSSSESSARYEGEQPKKFVPIAEEMDYSNPLEPETLTTAPISSASHVIEQPIEKTTSEITSNFTHEEVVSKPEIENPSVIAETHEPSQEPERGIRDHRKTRRYLRSHSSSGNHSRRRPQGRLGQGLQENSFVPNEENTANDIPVSKEADPHLNES